LSEQRRSASSLRWAIICIPKLRRRACSKSRVASSRCDIVTNRICRRPRSTEESFFSYVAQSYYLVEPLSACVSIFFTYTDENLYSYIHLPFLYRKSHYDFFTYSYILLFKTTCGIFARYFLSFLQIFFIYCVLFSYWIIMYFLKRAHTSVNIEGIYAMFTLRKRFLVFCFNFSGRKWYRISFLIVDELRNNIAKMFYIGPRLGIDCLW